MDWLSVVIWAISLYFAFRFGKGFGKSLVALDYKWKCYFEGCTFRVACTDATTLMHMSLGHLNDCHKPEVQDDVVVDPR